MSEKINFFSLALYELAAEENKQKEFVDLLWNLKNDLSSTEVINFFSNFNVSLQDKQIILQEILQEKIIINWILLLIENKLYKNILNLINLFFKYSAKDLNIKFGTIWLTEFIDLDVQNNIEKLISEKMNKKIRLEQKINKEILGGIEIVVEDTKWSNTIKNRIKFLTNTLLMKGK